MPDTIPQYHTPILGMTSRPRVPQPVEYGDPTSNDFWVEYPHGLVDLSRSTHLKDLKISAEKQLDIDTTKEPGAQNILLAGSNIITPTLLPGQLDVQMTGERIVRLDTEKTAVVIIDMQNFFLHKDIRDHPKGLACVDPLMRVVPFFREKNIKILWVNWGLTAAELSTIPPSLVRGFAKHGSPRGGGFGSELPGNFGKLLMRGERNSELYGPLQGLYENGRDKGSDFWIHKNRISGLWDQTLLENFLKENGLKTLFFAGVNADQCVLGTLIDAYFRGYDCILLEDATATTSPDGAFEAVIYNAANSYGFVTNTKEVLSSRDL
ncbi:Isochorismatase hydrolase [Lentinula aff. lateritia]|uniref:Isochorismatase hydrolase n=1 Tax=Lentinula aff. lateritia TaxID=2804960 RepID=A0ACC1UFW9_9AGAR|nr:Isochorismatase hydrolase [Lentinula aff. lateritia]